MQKVNKVIENLYYAGNRTRTCTVLLPLAPEASVSANSTIPAKYHHNYNDKTGGVNDFLSKKGP